MRFLTGLTKVVMTRTILKNLIVLTAMSFALVWGTDSLAGDYLKNISCDGPCMRVAWDEGVAVSGTGHCYTRDDSDDEWPSSWLYESAWVWYDCAGDGWTYNEAEVGQMDDQEIYAEARAHYWYHTCVDGYSWQRCQGDQQSGEYYDEPGCPWW